MKMNEGYIAISEVARILERSVGCVNNWAVRKDRNFPAPVNPPHVARGRRWRLEDIEAYKVFGPMWNRAHKSPYKTGLKFARLIDLTEFGSKWHLELPDAVMEDVLRYADESLAQYEQVIKVA